MYVFMYVHGGQKMILGITINGSPTSFIEARASGDSLSSPDVTDLGSLESPLALKSLISTFCGCNYRWPIVLTVIMWTLGQGLWPLIHLDGSLEDFLITPYSSYALQE